MKKKILAGLLTACLGIQLICFSAAGEVLGSEEEFILSDGSFFDESDIIAAENSSTDEEVSSDMDIFSGTEEVQAVGYELSADNGTKPFEETIGQELFNILRLYEEAVLYDLPIYQAGGSGELESSGTYSSTSDAHSALKDILITKGTYTSSNSGCYYIRSQSVPVIILYYPSTEEFGFTLNRLSSDSTASTVIEIRVPYALEGDAYIVYGEILDNSMVTSAFSYISDYSACNILGKQTLEFTVTSAASAAGNDISAKANAMLTDAFLSWNSELSAYTGITFEDLGFGKSGAVLEQPKLIAAYNGAKGIGIKFYSVENATEYVLYRKFDGAWSRVCTFSAADPGLQIDGNKIMFTDTSVAKNYGKGYIYSVAAKNATRETTYDTKGSAIYRLTPPALTKVMNSADRTVIVYWKGVFGKTETNGTYDLQIAEYKNGAAGTFRSLTALPGYNNLTLKTTVTGLERGARYVFRIRCAKTNKDRGTYYSEYSKWLSVTVP